MSTQTLAVTTAVALFAASNIATVQADQNSTAQASTARVVWTQPTYSKSMDELQRAAERLRESIQTLAQQAPGPQRDMALKAAREALYDTQQAMIRMPPELRTGTSSRGAVAGDYAQTMRELRHAADRLYNAIHAMAKQPAGERRNQAIREAHEALLETQSAMVWLPNQPGPTANQSTARGSAAAGAAFGSVSSSGIAAGSDASPVHGNASAMAGGVGLNARALLSNEAAPDHNVKMVFSLNTGNYLANVHVKVTNKSGKTVIDGLSDGPWLYARLSPGTYTANATYGGLTVSETFTVGSGGQRVAHFRWPASVEQHAAAGTDVSPILGTGAQALQR